MRVMQSDFRQLRHPQSEFDPRLAAIERHFGMRRLEECLADRKKTAIAIVPASKLRVAAADVTDFWESQVDLHVVIVVIEDGAAIDGEGRVLAQLAFDVHALDPAEYVAGDPMFLFKLGVVPRDVDAADSELDPVLRRLFLFSYGCGRGRLVIAGACRVSAKRSRAAEHRRALPQPPPAGQAACSFVSGAMPRGVH